MSDQPVTRLLLADHELPAAFPTAHVEVRRITMAPGIAPGAHTHNGPVFGLVVAGSVVFQLGDGPEVTLLPGEVFYEPADERINRFDAGDEGVEFVAWFPLPDGEAGALTLITDS